MNEPILYTDRLTLRPMSVTDADAAYEWCSSPDVNRFMTYPLMTDKAVVAEWLRQITTRPGYLFGIEVTQTAHLIGSCSIRESENGEWTFGYNIVPASWGKGYATEAMRRVIAFVHDDLGGKRFTAHHATANPASGRVLVKCGLHPVSTGEYSRQDGSETFPAIYYKMTLA